MMRHRDKKDRKKPEEIWDIIKLSTHVITFQAEKSTRNHRNIFQKKL